MKLLVTGANGFLGRFVVDEALRRGHAVRAMVRSKASAARAGWDDDPRVDLAFADLRSRRGLVEAVAGVDAVLHLAAAKSGDVYAQYGGTVVATENLLRAMDESAVRHIVHVSSFAVYDWLRMRGGSVVDENAPLEKDAFERDAYAHTKLVQERLVREHASGGGWKWTVLRPGMIIGPDNLWGARVGGQGKRLWVRFGAGARLPVTYVENVAEAIVLAAEREAAAGQVLNVVDDETPTQRQYVSLLRKRTSPRPRVIGLPWWGIRSAARLAWLANKLLLGNRARLPGILIPCRVHARFKPLKYTNRRIKEVLGWKPRYSLVEAIDRSMGRAARAPAPAPRAPADFPPVADADDARPPALVRR
jgi:nucleoside-diphosphate-sugar epimerase